LEHLTAQQVVGTEIKTNLRRSRTMHSIIYIIGLVVVVLAVLTLVA
jgi:hypothetical protein